METTKNSFLLIGIPACRRAYEGFRAALFFLKEHFLFLVPVVFALALEAGLDRRGQMYRYYLSDIPKLRDISFAGFSFIYAAFLILMDLGIALFGFCLIRNALDFQKGLLPMAILAGFPVGYVSSISILRVLTLFVPRPYVFPIGLLVLTIVGSLSLRKLTGPLNLKTLPSLSQLKTGLPNLILLGILFVLLLLLQMYMGDFTWVGHGQYAQLYQTPLYYFPFIQLHYDEALFHYFIESPLTRYYNANLPWWITLAIMKVSSLSLVYFLFRRLDFNQRTAAICTAFLFFGCFGFNPTKYGMLVDCGNPLAFSMHSGRVVGIPIVFLLLCDLLTGQHRLSLFSLLLIGMGITATSLSNFTAIGAIVGFLFLSHFTLRKQSPFVGRFFSPSVVLTALSIAWLSAYFSYEYPQWPGFPLLVGIALFGCYCLFFIFHGLIDMPEWSKQRGLSVRTCYFFIGGVLGLLFLGNILVRNPLAETLYSFLQVKTLSSLLQVNSSLGDTSATLFVDAREWVDNHTNIPRYAQYSWNGGTLLLNYGFLIYLGFFFFSFQRRQRHKTSDWIRQERLWISTYVFAVLLLMPLFFGVDFIQTGVRSWIRTRFFEVPVYVGLFTGIVLTAKALEARASKIFFYGLLVLFTALPLYSSAIPKQIVMNSAAFWELTGVGLSNPVYRFLKKIH